MSTKSIDLYIEKIERKLHYLQNFISYFKMSKYQNQLNQFKFNFAKESSQVDSSRRQSRLAFVNDRLKIFKKDIENVHFNKFSNTRAFHFKAALKAIPLVLIYDKLFTILETKRKFPKMGTINTKVFLYPIDTLASEVCQLLNRMKPFSHIDSQSLFNFMERVLNSYNHVSYHNFSHAFSVMQMFYYMISTSPKIKQLLPPEMIYTGLIGCISHDLSHRRLNQPARTVNISFKSKSNSKFQERARQIWKSFIAKSSRVSCLLPIAKFLVQLT